MRWTLASSVLLAATMAAGEQAAWLDVPFVRQVKAGCGSAAVAMVMQYWAAQGHPVDPARADAERIHQVLKPDSKKGVAGKAIRDYFEKNGFTVFVFDGEIADLRQHFDKGRPLIVCFAPGGAGAPLHYAVVAGIDNSSVFLNDPARGKLTRESLESFERVWKMTRNWALLAVPGQAKAG